MSKQENKQPQQFFVKRHQTWREYETAHIRNEIEDTFCCANIDQVRSKYAGLHRALTHDYKDMHFDWDLYSMHGDKVLDEEHALCELNAKRRKKKSEREAEKRAAAAAK